MPLFSTATLVNRKAPLGRVLPGIWLGWTLAQVGCLPRDEPHRDSSPVIEAVAKPSALAAPVSPPEALDPEILRLRRFTEAPMLARRVAAGELPPVAGRLPENPLVVRPLDETGVYGGTIRRALMSEYEGFNEVSKTLGETLLGYRRPVGDAIEVGIAESYTISEEGRSAVFHLRRGLKWSDGVPFTCDDLLFWYYDVLFDSTVKRPGFSPSDWQIDGKAMKFEKIDDFTLRVSAEKPMGLLVERLCHDANFALPKHYFAPYHPKYNPAATYRDFERRISPQNQLMAPGVPRMSAWVPVKWNEGQQILYERNPYYYKVDTAGNQLPYADRLSFVVVSDPRVILLKFINGEIDLEGRYVAINWIPTLAAEVPKGRFQMRMRTAEAGPVLYLNWDAKDGVLRAAFRDVRVREALSLAINRREISQIVYYGNLSPAGFGLSPSSPYYLERYSRRAAEYLPDRARRLLDEAGYRDSNGDGFRELPGGRRFEVVVSFIFEKTLSDAVQMVAEYWEAAGIKVHLDTGREELMLNRRDSGDFQIYAHAKTYGAENPRGSAIMWGIVDTTSPFWHRDASKEKPPWLMEGTQLLNRAIASVDETAVRDMLGHLQELYAEKLPAIGLGGITRPWVASVRLGNVPETGTFSDEQRGWSRPVFHEQIFIRPVLAGP